MSRANEILATWLVRIKEFCTFFVCNVYYVILIENHLSHTVITPSNFLIQRYNGIQKSMHIYYSYATCSCASLINLLS